MLKQIIVRSREKENTAKKTKFLVWKAKKLDGTWVKLKFRQEVDNLPKNEGTYIMTVNTEYMNKSHDDWGEVYWVAQNPEAFEPIKNEDTAQYEF